jgi:hypothetical protein
MDENKPPAPQEMPFQLIAALAAAAKGGLMVTPVQFQAALVMAGLPAAMAPPPMPGARGPQPGGPVEPPSARGPQPPNIPGKPAPGKPNKAPASTPAGIDSFLSPPGMRTQPVDPYPVGVGPRGG